LSVRVALTVTLPAAIGVRSPFEPPELLMVAKLLFEDFQVAWLVTSWVDESVKVAIAVNCTAEPSWILVVPEAFETTMDEMVMGLTVSVVEFVIEPRAAVTVTVPAPPSEVARPLAPTALLTVTIVLLDEVQTTAAVTSWVDPLSKKPVAVNCCVVPEAIWGAEGDIETEVRTPGVTVSVVAPVLLWNNADMVVVAVPVPPVTGVDRPLKPAALLTVATAVSEEVQADIAVIS